MSTKKKSGKKKSGNPAISKVSDWKVEAEGTALELPSGKVALCKRVGMKVFLKAGVVPDYLVATVQELIRSKQYAPPSAMKELAGDPMAVLKTMELLDRALAMTVLQPKVLMPPGCGYEFPDDHPDAGGTCGKWLNYNDKDLHNHESGHYDHDYVEPERNHTTLYADEVQLDDKMFIFNWSVGGGTDLTEFRKQWDESMAAMEAFAGDGNEAEQPAGSGT